MYDLLVQGGKVIDVAQGIYGQSDIAIYQGEIASVAPNIDSNQTKRKIDATGKIVTPGLIDIHAHVTGGLTPFGVDPEEDGVFSGVTTVCDGGSTGPANFTEFNKLIIQRAKTDVFCFLALHPTGQTTLPEDWNHYEVDAPATLKTIAENRRQVKGVKVRAVAAVAEKYGVQLVKLGKEIAAEAGVPLVVHIGKDPAENASEEMMESLTREVLSLLNKGDILVHIYTPKMGQAIKPDGSVLSELKEAIERGVILDLAQGSGNLSFSIARKVLDMGIFPSTLSTDISTIFPFPGLALTRIMSAFLALGMSLEKVIETTTVNPARALGEEHRRGSLRTGMPADITILEPSGGDFTFVDSVNTTIKGNLLLTPRMTLKSGVEIQPKQPENRTKN